jgi:hypothetical protein
MSFPVDTIPDGAIFAPHHYTYGMLLVLVMIFVVWDNFRDREPLLSVLATGSGLFSFLYVWPFYPVAGAIGSVVAPVLVIGVVLMGWAGLSVGDVWDDYPVLYRAMTIVFSILALDDAVEHAFGVWTPFDALWQAYLVDKVAVASLVGVGMIVASIVLYLVWGHAQKK